jgi:hypothetical protein
MFARELRLTCPAFCSSMWIYAVSRLVVPGRRNRKFADTDHDVTRGPSYLDGSTHEWYTHFLAAAHKPLILLMSRGDRDNPLLGTIRKKDVKISISYCKSELSGRRCSTQRWYTWPSRWRVPGSIPRPESIGCGSAFRTICDRSSSQPVASTNCPNVAPFGFDSLATSSACFDPGRGARSGEA